MDENKIEALEAEHAELGSRAEARARTLAAMRARLDELPDLLIAAEGKKHDALAAEFGELAARVRVLAAEVRRLRHKQAEALVAIFTAKEAEAQEAFRAYHEDVYRPAVVARDGAIKAVMHAQNAGGARTAQQVLEHNRSLVDLRVARERAISHLALEVVPQSEALKRQRDAARAEREAAERDAAELAAQPV